MLNLRAKYKRMMSNPNVVGAVLGCFFFLVLIVVIISLYVAIVVISSSIGGKGTISAFVKNEWVNALEKGDTQMYRKLWEKNARIKNNEHYEKAVEIIQKDLEVDEEKIKPIRDLRNNNLYHIRNVPVTLKDNGLEILTYRNLKIEKVGLLKRWKIIDDEIDFLKDEMPVIAESPDDSIEETDENESKPLLEDSSVVKKEENQELEIPFNSRHPEDSLAMISGNAPLGTKLTISQVVSDWQSAWQEQNLEKYMSKYHKDAVITRVTFRNGKQYPISLTKRELRKHMQTINRRYKTIDVTISNMRIDGDRVIADVRFRQKFVGARSDRLPVYSDIGTKTMIFIMDASDGYWKIHEENWRRYVSDSRFLGL